MAPHNLELDDHQKFTLMKFRRSVSDVTQPHHDDKFLLRWLRARSWDAEAAEKMLRQSMKWRQQWDIDSSLKTWPFPEIVVNYYPYGHCGYDKDEAPVYVVPFGGFDVVGIIHSASRKDLYKATIKILENCMSVAAEKGHHQLTVIFDMDGFILRPFIWKPAAEFVINLIKMYEANYPETLKACFIINAPRVFAIAFNIVKKFMDAYTISKIQIYKNDPKKWKQVLLDHIDPDNLPQYFGGNLVDPDGNPRYTTRINQGGKVPKHLYLKNFENSPENVNYTTVLIKKGGKLVLDFPVTEEGSLLKWDFRTEEHDIRFGVAVKNADGITNDVIPQKRVAAQHTDENGVLECQAPATYEVTFDNSYSLIRGKKLHYNIAVAPPINNLDTSSIENDIEEGIDIATTTSVTQS